MPKLDLVTLEKGIRAVIAEIIEIGPEEITLEANFVENLGMDSMMALEILAAIEKKYKIQIPEEKLNKIRNLKETINLTNEYLNIS